MPLGDPAAGGGRLHPTTPCDMADPYPNSQQERSLLLTSSDSPPGLASRQQRVPHAAAGWLPSSPAHGGGGGPCLHLGIVPIISCPGPSPGRVNRPGVPLWRNVMSGLD